MPTPREALIAEAESLKVIVNPQWGDKRLQKEIDKALAAPPTPPLKGPGPESEPKPETEPKPDPTPKQATLPSVPAPVEHLPLAIGDKIQNALDNVVSVASILLAPGETLTITADHFIQRRMMAKFNNGIKSATFKKV